MGTWFSEAVLQTAYGFLGSRRGGLRKSDWGGPSVNTGGFLGGASGRESCQCR